MNFDALADALGRRLEGRVERDLSLARLTTYRLGGPAALYVEPASTADLQLLGEILRDHEAHDTAVPLLPVGRGSNVVISDAGFPGIVIHLGTPFSWTTLEASPASGERRRMKAGAATPLPQVANWAARRGLAGAEFMIAIPGSVGGGVKMNAGAHGRAISDALDAARVFDIEALELRDLSAGDLDHGYRVSNVTESQVVVEASFELSVDEPAAVRIRMEGFREHRARTQPGAAQNAGSVFKNPPGDSAGRLVEAAGLKGFRVGGAEVSGLHANFFMADEGASAQDVFDLVARVQARVEETFGIVLEPEIRFIGSFAQNASQGTR